MRDTLVTLHGWVGNDVTHRVVNDVSVVNMRVASTPRVRRGGEWRDGQTTWFTVTAWRALADHVSSSVKKGDAVIVHGRLRSESWEREDGQVATTLAVEAQLVGHDLTRGTSVFWKASKPDRSDSDPHDEVSEMIRAEGDAMPQVSSWGEPLDASRTTSQSPPPDPHGERSNESSEEHSAA